MRCVGSPCEGCGYTLGEAITARNVQMEKVTPIKVDDPVEKLANDDDKMYWLEDMGAYMYGNVRCRQCGSCFPGSVGHCEECEDYEAQTRVRCTPQGAVYLPPFVARDPATGLLHVRLEPSNETDDAFNELIRCFENIPLEAPKANASNLKVSLGSIVRWFLCQQKPTPNFFVEQPPSFLTPFGETSVTDTSRACCQNFGVYVGRNLTVRVVYKTQTVGRRPVYYGRDCVLIDRLWRCLWRYYHRSTGVFGAWDNWVRSFFLIATMSHCPRVSNAVRM